MRGWRGLHLPDLLVPCELPEGAAAWRSQQQRWAKGNAQVLRKLMLAIARSPASVGAKIECFLHLTSSCVHPVNLLLALLLVPSLWLRAGAPPALLAVDGVIFGLNMLSVGGYFALSQRERRDAPDAPDARGWVRELRFLPSLMALGVGASLSQSVAVLEGLFGADVVFHRTPKPGRMRRPTGSYRAPPSRLIPVEAAIALGYGAAVVAAASRGEVASLPFLLLFFHGFAHVAGISAWEAIRDRVGPAGELAAEAP
jgi:hypothetical protein